MYGTGIVCLFIILSSIYPEVWSDVTMPVRLGGGSTPRQGRIEVYHDGQWGTVCDDGNVTTVCNIICKQLGYGSEGLCINEDAKHGCQQNDGTVFGPSTLRIWLDEIDCEGAESSIDECRRTVWGVTNCGHKEDLGCICNHVTTVSSGSCNNSRHRIVPFDRSNPTMGRVEIQDENGSWGLVCDDHWDDFDATVFCDCLGYRGRHTFRALISPNHTSCLPMLYDAVRCKEQDTVSTKNLWDCDVVKAERGKCDPNMEAAGVVCGSQPAWVSPVIPNVALSCDGQWLSGSFEPESDVSEAHFFTSPSCDNATISKKDDGTIYVRIDMSTCEASHTTVNASTKHYCHDIIFSKFGDHSDPLLTETIWTRRLCCILSKTGTAVGSFLPQTVVPLPVYKDNAVVNNFTMTCYRYQDFSEDNSTALEFPAFVQHGEPVSCSIGVRTWDPKLYMVVSDCKFMASLNNSGLQFVFLRNKCPTTNDLGLIFYNVDHHNYGFRFKVPKFKTYDELYVSCDIYLCDTEQETKPYCDRSCSATHIPDTTTDRVMRDPERSKRHGRRVLYSRNSVRTKRKNGHIERGPFLIEDGGVGLLINNLGQLIRVAGNQSDVHPDEKGAVSKMENLANPIPLMATGQATQVVACSLWLITSINLLI